MENTKEQSSKPWLEQIYKPLKDILPTPEEKKMVSVYCRETLKKQEEIEPLLKTKSELEANRKKVMNQIKEWVFKLNLECIGFPLESSECRKRFQKKTSVDDPDDEEEMYCIQPIPAKTQTISLYVRVDNIHSTRTINHKNVDTVLNMLSEHNLKMWSEKELVKKTNEIPLSHLISQMLEGELKLFIQSNKKRLSISTSCKKGFKNKEPEDLDAMEWNQIKKLVKENEKLTIMIETLHGKIKKIEKEYEEKIGMNSNNDSPYQSTLNYLNRVLGNSKSMVIHLFDEKMNHSDSEYILTRTTQTKREYFGITHLSKMIQECTDYILQNRFGTTSIPFNEKENYQEILNQIKSELLSRMEVHKQNTSIQIQGISLKKSKKRKREEAPLPEIPSEESFEPPKKKMRFSHSEYDQNDNDPFEDESFDPFEDEENDSYPWEEYLVCDEAVPF